MNSILLYLLHEILEGQIPFCGDECHFKVDSHGTRFAAQVGAITTWVLYPYYRSIVIEENSILSFKINQLPLSTNRGFNYIAWAMRHGSFDD